MLRACHADATKRVFLGYKTIDTGIKHGTVTVVISHTPYEITTYRIDGDYKDSRHPDSVAFTRELSSDLERRDFTINAMAYNHKDGLTDLFGGREDLALGVIRAVGDPDLRFCEDALRIMRAIRFASVLDFAIDEATLRAARNNKELMRQVSAERIYVEWKKLLAGKAAHRIIGEYSDILSVVIPYLTISELPRRDLFDSADTLSRMLSLYYRNSATPCEDFSRSMRALKTDNHTRLLGEGVLSAIDSVTFGTTKGILKGLKSYGAEVMEAATSLASLLGKEADRALLTNAITSGIPYRISELAIGGDDLTSLGIRGPRVGEILNHLLDEVIDGKVANERKTLVSRVKDVL